MKTMIKTLAASVSVCLSTAVFADEIAITGATVHTMGKQGTVDNATVLVENGKIKSVKKAGKVPRGYKQIDATGKVVTPGIIGAYTALGLVEVEYSAGITDYSVKMEDASYLGTQIDVSYAINPDSSLMDIARIDGITSAVTGISYTDTMFAGQGAVITLGDKANPLLKGKAVMSVDLTGDAAEGIAGGSRAILWPKFMSVLAEADSLGGKALAKDDDWDGDLSRADVNALVPVMTGDMPLLVSVKRLSDIRNVLSVKRTYKDVDIILLNPTEAWRIAEELAEHNIGVVLDPENNLPYDFEQLGATLSNAAKLQAAGVTLAIGVNTHNIRLATQHAGNAVAHGMPWQEGLAAITSNVAELFGVEEQIGSLSKGKRADLVVWSGDPLEVMSYAENVIINGEEMPMESRQSKLRDRYMADSKDAPYRYIKP